MSLYKSTLMVTVLVGVAICSTAWSERTPPPEVEPVEHEGVRYEADYGGSQDVNTAMITAIRLSTEEEIWSVVVYEVHIDDSLEEDVQWIYISKMEIKDGALLVENERGGRYRIDLHSHSVEVLSGNSVYGDDGDWGCAMGRARQGTMSILALLLSMMVSF